MTWHLCSCPLSDEVYFFKGLNFEEWLLVWLFAWTLQRNVNKQLISLFMYLSRSYEFELFHFRRREICPEKSYQKIQNFKNVIPCQLGVSLIAWVGFYPNSERLTVASEGSKRLFSCQTWSLDCPTPWRMFTMTFTGSWNQLDGT